jgi:hypothetical protein
LCTAYAAGGLHFTSVAYTSLLTASQDAGSISDYCAPILAAAGIHGASGEHSQAGDHGPASQSDSSDNGQSGSDHSNASADSHSH